MYRGVPVAMFEDIGRVNPYLVGGFNHLEKNSQWEGLSHILWKIKND